MATPTIVPRIDLESALEACVEEHYQRVLADPELVRVFHDHVQNIPEHLRIVCDYWSHALLGTGRYPASPLDAHKHLPIEPAHFDRWLVHFRDAARLTLPQDYADRAIAEAERVMAGLKGGFGG